MQKKILVKIPTRGRRLQLFSMLDLYLSYLQSPKDIEFLIVADADDETMQPELVKPRLDWLQTFYEVPINIVYGYSENKIHAVNRDTPDDWDILILTSDDMQPICYGYDSIIRKDMNEHFPDTDGILYYPDGFTNLNTLPILGKKYYDRFGYIYNPLFKSFFCDNVFHEIGDILKKQYYANIVLFKHYHPCNTGIGWDDVYEKNNTPWDEDKLVYAQLKAVSYEGHLGKEYI